MVDIVSHYYHHSLDINTLIVYFQYSMSGFVQYHSLNILLHITLLRLCEIMVTGDLS